MPTVEQILLRKGSGVIGATPATIVREAALKMMEADVACLVVEQFPDVLGVFTERDLVRRVVAAGKDPAATCLAEVLSSPVRTCAPGDDPRDCARLMVDEHLRHLVVLDEGQLVGVLSVRDLLAAELRRT
jgi:CBS domain-containing protein